MPIIDNFSRALLHVPENLDSDTKIIIEGISMTRDALIDVFKKHGIESIEPHSGDNFDYNNHYAISQVVTDQHKEGSIVSTMQTGCKIKDKACFSCSSKEIIMVAVRVRNNILKSKAIAFNFPSLKVSFLVLVVFLILCPKLAQCATNEISEVFIEVTGNNKYVRAFFLVADKTGIKHSNIQEAPYSRLKEVFKPVMVFDEYNATVTYQYDKAKLYQLLLDYGNNVVQDVFYEALVLPVFKQRNVFNIWDKEKKWNDIWYESKATHEQS